MNAKQLIEELQKMPPEIEVLIPVWGYFGDNERKPVAEVELCENNGMTWIALNEE